MVKINPSLIPETETKLIAMTFLDAIKRFYSDPKNVEKFQEWKQNRYLKMENLITVQHIQEAFAIQNRIVL